MRLAVAVAVVCLSVVSLSVASDVEASIKKQTDIPAQGLGPALEAFAKERDVQVVYRSEVVGTLQTPGASGNLTPNEALTQLLRGTDLTYAFLDEKTVTIIPLASAPLTDASGAGPASPSVQPPPEAEGSKVPSDRFRVAQVDQGAPSDTSSVEKNKEKAPEKKADQLEEVVVTGTHIRGVAPDSTPVITYSQAEILQSGAATLEQFARKMPENFSSADGSAQFVNGKSNFNQIGGTEYAGSGFNLHGLGTGATLTLLDGHRLSGGGQGGDLVDISMIPVSAIERIDVLTDGASAIYGADAVAGVVNIILRKDFEGAETGVRYGAATRGGAGELTASQLVGTSWSGGGGMLSFEHDKQDGLLSSERNFIPDQGGRLFVFPEQKRDSVFLTGHQGVFDNTSVSGDAFFSRRAFDQDNFVSGLQQVATGKVEIFGESIGVGHDLVGDWRGNISEQYSVTQQSSFSDYLGGLAPPSVLNTRFRLVNVDLLADGTVLSIPGGAVKGAFGGAYRTERLEDATLASFGSAEGALNRRVGSVFAESLVPIVGERNAVLGVRRLELSLAARFDHYDEFGSRTDPKLGILWAPAAGLIVRGTYGKSFQPPSLFSLAPQPSYLAYTVTDPASATGMSDALFNLSQGNPALQPQLSKSFTAGFELRPPSIPTFNIVTSFFHTRFDDLIGAAAVPGGLLNVLANAPYFAPFINRSPNYAYLQQLFASGIVTDIAGPGFTPLGPNAVQVVVDGRLQNLSVATQSGIDASSSYTVITSHGDLGLSVAGTHFLRYDYQPVVGLPALTLANRVGEPLSWKANGGVHWTSGVFHSDLLVNYANAYLNDYLSPPTRIASWTTVDLNLAYQPNPSAVHTHLKGLSAALTIQNLFDRPPPSVQIPAGLVTQSLGFDPANASAVGRFIALQLRYNW